MLDDLRSHDPRPSSEESEWMRMDPVDALARAVLMAGIAMAVGVGVGILVTPLVASVSAAAIPSGVTSSRKIADRPPISISDELRAQSTGHPWAIASTTGRPKPSYEDG